MPTLTTGSYTIRSLAHESGGAVYVDSNNNSVTVHSKVISNAKNHDYFHVEQIGGRGCEYVITYGGTSLEVVDGKLVVRPDVGDKVVQRWIVDDDERSGNKPYFIIRIQDKSKGWVVSSFEDEISKIDVGLLIVGLSLPPFFPPNEVWEFTKVDA